MKISSMLLLIFISTEIILFYYNFSNGPRGLHSLDELHSENQQLRQKIDETRHKVAHIKHKIEKWNKNFFYKEKIAREELHMARADEIIFIKSN